MTTAFAARRLPDDLEQIFEVPDVHGGVAHVGIRLSRAGELVDAYPAGTDDRELLIQGQPSAAAVAELTAQVLAARPRCRRVVLPVPEQDLDAIGWAEDAGFRYVVDVETRSGGYSLLVTEPEWVLAQPHILDDIPLTE